MELQSRPCIRRACIYRTNIKLFFISFPPSIFIAWHRIWRKACGMWRSWCSWRTCWCRCKYGKRLCSVSSCRWCISPWRRISWCWKRISTMITARCGRMRSFSLASMCAAWWWMWWWNGRSDAHFWIHATVLPPGSKWRMRMRNWSDCCWAYCRDMSPSKWRMIFCRRWKRNSTKSTFRSTTTSAFCSPISWDSRCLHRNAVHRSWCVYWTSSSVDSINCQMWVFRILPQIWARISWTLSISRRTIIVCGSKYWAIVTIAWLDCPSRETIMRNVPSKWVSTWSMQLRMCPWIPSHREPKLHFSFS